MHRNSMFSFVFLSGKRVFACECELHIFASLATNHNILTSIASCILIKFAVFVVNLRFLRLFCPSPHFWSTRIVSINFRLTSRSHKPHQNMKFSFIFFRFFRFSLFQVSLAHRVAVAKSISFVVHSPIPLSATNHNEQNYWSLPSQFELTECMHCRRRHRLLWQQQIFQ